MTKFGKKTVWLAIACTFLAIQVGTASAQTTKVCFNTQLTRIGTTPADTGNGNTGYRFEAQGGTCNLAANTALFLHTDLGDAGLATLLTAFSMGKTITMRVPDPMAGNDLVNTIHLDQ